jgi:predicted component of viral defense system (DUF524 family)
MVACDLARIDCRSLDGALMARVLVTPDMAESSLVEQAPIVRLTEEDNSDGEPTSFQLIENGRYYYDLELPDGETRDLRLRCSTICRRKPRLLAGRPDSGRIETGNFCGTLLLEIVEGEANKSSKVALASALVDVRSVKLGYQSEYRGMLRDLTSRMADLVADARSSAKTPFRSTFEERDDEGWFQLQLELLRETIESLEFTAAMQRILSFPHERLEHETGFLAVDRPIKWTAQASRALVTSPLRRKLPENHALRKTTGLDTVSARVPVIRKIPSVDTAENRFVRYVLRDFLAFLARAERVFEKAGDAWLSAAGLAKRLSLNLEQWISRPLFQEIGELKVIPIGSPVLQRKAGYREILQWWLRFRTAAELSWEGGTDLFRAGQRNVADLYEYWLFFGLLDWFCTRFDRSGTKPLAEQLMDGLDENSPCLKVKKQVPLGPFTGSFSNTHRKLHASFHYNREFKITGDRGAEGSWSRGMHPDYTLTFWPAIDGKSPDQALAVAELQELLVHIHLDAKYRIDSLQKLFGSKKSNDADLENSKSPGNYKRQDLLKMHAYRDAIKRSEGAYILYPGDDRCRRMQVDKKIIGPDRWRQVMRGFHEVIPGLGAFAIAPDENGKPKGIDGEGHLAGFLEDVLENLCNRASLRERRSSILHEVLRERTYLKEAGEDPEVGSSILQGVPEFDSDLLRMPAAPEIMVLVVWFDGESAKRWILDNLKSVARLGNRRGSLPLVKSLAAATHILLHGRGKDSVPGLWRIAAGTGPILTRKELFEDGFPSDPSKDLDDIFAVFSIEQDQGFSHLLWNGDGIEMALRRFENRQRPSYREELKKLTRSKALPRVVSLADLQLALANQHAEARCQ